MNKRDLLHDSQTDKPPASSGDHDATACPVPSPPDMSGITVVPLHPRMPVADYLEAMQLAHAEAGARLNDHMLLSWYDRDRDFEAPQHVSECHQDSAVPGYVDYGIHHGATLMVDVENGRFVFFYRPVDI
jgi:hypothetical protein